MNISNFNQLTPSSLLNKSKSTTVVSQKDNNLKDDVKRVSNQTIDPVKLDKNLSQYQQVEYQLSELQQSLVKQQPTIELNTESDQPSAQNLTAVHTYSQHETLAKRESIQQLFGVDIFA